ncbi:hypothetical protein HDV62DRAFT_214060 [Trichoderma sp. SZMC 28011]
MADSLIALLLPCIVAINSIASTRRGSPLPSSPSMTGRGCRSPLCSIPSKQPGLCGAQKQLNPIHVSVDLI